MADALLSPAVGLSMCAVGAASVAYSVRRSSKDDLLDGKVPMMGVMGAFVFAAQMVNFSIPATGSSGHIGGGVLLAAMVGGYPAMIPLSAVLMIQCLFFADGGLLALGCNIFNIAVIPCLIAYPLIFRPIVSKGRTAGRIAAASIISSVVGLQVGSLCVVLQTWLSGVAELPFGAFLLFMQPIHLAIGVVEGLVTAAILCFVHKARPGILDGLHGDAGRSPGAPMGKVIAAAALATVLVGGALPFLASTDPDGLEWSIGNVAEEGLSAPDGGLHGGAASVQDALAFMPDYEFGGADGDGAALGPSAAGLVGGAVTFAAAGAAAFGINRYKGRRKAISAK